MIGEYKKFDEDLFNKNDPKSRKVVKDYLFKSGIVVDDNPNRYGVDLISNDGKLQIEIEHRLVWKQNEFPYSSVNVPERKAKFFTDESVSYVILSCDYKKMGVITGKKLRKYIDIKNLKESSNRFINSGELFYKIPKEQFKWVSLE